MVQGSVDFFVNSVNNNLYYLKVRNKIKVTYQPVGMHSDHFAYD